MTITELAPEIKEKTDSLIVLKVSRDHTGISIHIKSQIFEECMKNHAGHSTKLAKEVTNNNKGWKDHAGYQFTDKFLADCAEYNFNGWGEGLFLNNQPNMSFLTAKGLAEGLDFNIGGLYSKEKLQEWVRLFKVQAVKFYKTFMKPANITLRITIEEV